VPEEASGLRQPRFWIRVFLLLDRLPAKANEPCLPTRALSAHTHTQTDRQTDASDFIICPMLCYSNGTDKNALEV